MHSRLRKTPNTATPGAVVQLVRIRACHARGRGFEPHPHRKNASHICEGHFSYGIVCSWAKAGTCVVEPDYEDAMTCVNRAFFTHGKNSHDGVGCIKTSLRLLTSPATWFIFCDSFRMSIWFRLKRFPRTKHVSKALPYRLKRFRGTKFRFYPTGKRDRKKTATSTGSPARIPNWNYTTLIPTAAESLVKTYQCQIFAGPGLGLLVIQVCHLEFHQNGITLDNIGEKRLCARTHQRTDIHVSLTDVTVYR